MYRGHAYYREDILKKKRNDCMRNCGSQIYFYLYAFISDLNHNYDT